MANKERFEKSPFLQERRKTELINSKTQFIRLNHNFCYTFSFFLGKTVEASGIFGRGGYIKRVKRTTH